MKILIIGGNRFVGKKLAFEMVQRGHEVTVLNRGQFKAQGDGDGDGLGARVQRIVCDRNASNLGAVLDQQHPLRWDVVYDHVCFTQAQAKAAVEVFENRTERYIFISTLSIYDEGLLLKESEFNPIDYLPRAEVTEALLDYREAKRQCEWVFAHSKLGSVFIRFPLIVGTDDYTGRFAFHIEHIRNSQPFILPSPSAKVSFIESGVAARALADLSTLSVRGPLNLSSPDPIELMELFERIRQIHGGAIRIVESASAENEKKFDISPFGFTQDFCQDVGLALSLGIRLPKHAEWLEDLIRVC